MNEVKCIKCDGKGTIVMHEKGDESNKMNLPCPLCLGSGKLYAKRSRSKK
jgi:DnaJ-class molecular chaperone